MAYYQTLFNYSRFVRYDSSAITAHRFDSPRQRISCMRADLLEMPSQKHESGEDREHKSKPI